MKTSEFRQYLTSKWAFTEEEKHFAISGVAIVYKNNSKLHLLMPLNLGGGGRELFDKIVEYVETPLEEREEETKYYRLMLPDGFSRQFRFLNYDINREHYVFSSSLELGNNRIKFTQKEIDGMPFDTSFLIKEEVY